MQIERAGIKKILIIRFKGLGDILLCQPAIRAVKTHFKNAEVTVLINKNAKDILSGLQYVDNLILFDKSADKPFIRDIELIENVM